MHKLICNAARTAATVAFAIAGIAPAAAAQRALPPDSAVLAIIRDRVDTHRAAGIAVGLIDANGQRRTVAWGAGADGAPLDAHSVFEIGSISKTFTASILVDMVVQGTVRLDQAVADLLPRGTVIPERSGRAITLVDLATQSSGLPRMPDNFAPRDPDNPYADYDGARLLAFLAHYQLTRDIGARYEYSNLGVGLLGYALAQRAGVSYEHMLAEHVLGPLGMHESGIALTRAMKARLAPGHDRGMDPVANWDLDAFAGAGAIRSTVSDMLRYLAANMDSTSLPLGRTLALTHARRAAGPASNVSIGLAWHRQASATGDTIVWHNGETGGYHSFIGWDPVRRVGVVILSNSSGTIDDIALHLLDQRIALLKAPPARAEVSVAPAVLARYTGEYRLSPTFAIAVTSDGQALYVQATGQRRFHAYAESEARFFLKAADAQIEFTTDSTGAVDALVLIQGGARQRAPKGR